MAVIPKDHPVPPWREDDIIVLLQQKIIELRKEVDELKRFIKEQQHPD
jgi:Tfp pilus assembly protein PilN